MNRSKVVVPGVEAVFPQYPVAMKAAGLVFVSGVRAGMRPRTFEAVPAEARVKQQGFTLADHDEGLVTVESWWTHDIMEKVLTAAGSSGEQILRQHIWQRDKRFFPCYEAVRKHWQPSPSPSSGLGVKAIAGARQGWIGIDAIAVCPDVASPFTPRSVVAAVDYKALPSASHYSQAVKSGPFVFTAGHIAIKTGEPGKPLVNSFDDVPPEGRFLATGRSHPDSRDGPIAAQTWYVIRELQRTLEDKGLGLKDVVNATVYLADLRDLATFHRVHRHFFPSNPPALCIVGFDEVGHRGCRIEVELTAVEPSAKLERVPVAWPGPAPFHAPAALRVGPLLFYSGMPGLTAGGLLADGASHPPSAQALVTRLSAKERVPGLAAQCWAALDTLQATARQAGSSLQQLAKTTVYLAHEDDLAVYEAVREAFMGNDDLPAFECVVVHGPGPLATSHVQVEAIGAVV